MTASERRAQLTLAYVVIAFGLGGIFTARSYPANDPSINVLASASGILTGVGIAIVIIARRSFLSDVLSKASALLTIRNLAALAFCGAAVSNVCAGLAQGPSDDTRGSLIQAAVFAGIAFGLLCVGARACLNRLLNDRRVFVGCSLALATAIGILVHWCGMRQFAGFDQGPMVDLGWRLLNGQRPISDFPSTFPIGFVMGSYYAFLALGVHWQSLVLVFAGFSAVTFLWSVWLLSYLFEDRVVRLSLAIALQACANISLSFWWYNALTATTGVIFVLSIYVWLRRPELKAPACSYFASMLLLASTKPNGAGPLLVVGSLILLTSSTHWIKAATLSAAAVLVFFVCLRLQGVSLASYVSSYLAVSGRGFELSPFFGQPLGMLQLVALLILSYILLPLFVCLPQPEVLRQPRFAGLGVLCVVAGLDNFLTAGETKVVDAGIIFLGVALVWHAASACAAAAEKPRSDVFRMLGTYMTLLALALTGLGIAVGVTRDRIAGAGPFFENVLEREPLKTGFFRGLYCGAGFKETYAQLAATVRRDRKRTFFFGPRMEWGYAAFKRPSPTRMPAVWDPGRQFPVTAQARYIDAFIGMRVGVLVFLKNDMTYYPAELVKLIHENYSEDQSLSRLTIYRLKSAAEDNASGMHVSCGIATSSSGLASR